MALYQPISREKYGVRPDLLATVEGAIQPGQYAAQTLYGPTNALGTATPTEAQPGIAPNVGAYLQAVGQQEPGRPSVVQTRPGMYEVSSPSEVQQNRGYSFVRNVDEAIGKFGEDYVNDYEKFRAAGHPPQEASKLADANKQKRTNALYKPQIFEIPVKGGGKKILYGTDPFSAREVTTVEPDFTKERSQLRARLSGMRTKDALGSKPTYSPDEVDRIVETAYPEKAFTPEEMTPGQRRLYEGTFTETQPQELDEATAQQYLDQAGGDVDMARQLARDAGYTF